ncbi:Ppx/GppA family phosphatase [Vaginisenegalia massiliensis]|uniref:Ppx/GppA family phosphatase n=1 Tax=Vaginisenegalia massiliensis TaxID=2058294 RepID=UPI000F532439|nr:Ppx/GppA family phosphatase [Vaginisenegalia massiliensis]
MYKEKVGIIDIGSNTIRLVIYGIDHYYNYIELQNIKTPARLSQNLEQIGGQTVMSQAGIDKLVETLQSFKYVWQAAQAQTLKVMATAAVRQSANQEDILAQVKAQTGLTIEIVSEEEEASFGQYAILHSLPIEDAITIDLGGGSCEITLIEQHQMKAYHSFPFGAVSLQKQFFNGLNHNDSDAMAALRRYVNKQLKSLDWLKKAKLPIIAVGGSARNIALVHQFLTDYPLAGVHGYQMKFDDLQTTLKLFAQTPFSQLDNIDGLSTDRRDIIIPANIVFIELMDFSKAPSFAFSSQGLREGIIAKYINQSYNSPIDIHLIKARTIQKILYDFPNQIALSSEIRAKYTIDLYHQASQLGCFDYTYCQQEELEYAAYLYLFGDFISPEADSQHTFYLLSNMNLLGFTHKGRIRLALLASYRNKTLFNHYLRGLDHWFTDQELEQLQRLGGLIKFAQALNDSQTGPISKIQLVRNKNKHLELQIYHHHPIVAEEYRINRHIKHLERALNSSDIALSYFLI